MTALSPVQSTVVFLAKATKIEKLLRSDDDIDSRPLCRQFGNRVSSMHYRLWESSGASKRNLRCPPRPLRSNFQRKRPASARDMGVNLSSSLVVAKTGDRPINHFYRYRPIPSLVSHRHLWPGGSRGVCRRYLSAPWPLSRRRTHLVCLGTLSRRC